MRVSFVDLMVQRPRLPASVEDEHRQRPRLPPTLQQKIENRDICHAKKQDQQGLRAGEGARRE
ncbi:hypothetical protein ELO17_29215, partial [Klebsiella pneumoniae]|nr:hypothetical protein [Klebsiella pneumoniae]